MWDMGKGKPVNTNDTKLDNGGIGYHFLGNDGKSNVTYNLYTGRGLFNTVANIQNMFVHEYFGHGFKGWNDDNRSHYKVYELQMSHSTWRDVTIDYQTHLLEACQPYLYHKN